MKNILLFSIIFISFFFSCKRQDTYEQFQNIKADQTKQWVRFERELHNIDTNQMLVQLNQLIKTQPEFAMTYFYRVINDYYKPDTSLVNIFNLYRHSPIVLDVYDTIQTVYKDLSQQEQLFSDAFARLKQLIPGVEEPTIYTCLTEFSTAAFSVSDTTMGISLDMYLGRGYKYYDVETWPLFVQNTMNQQNMVPNLLKNYIRNTLMPDQSPKSLLEFMIQDGKEAYILKHLLPAEQDSLIFDYTGKQMAFVKESESQLWAFFISEKLLHETDLKKTQKYVLPSPHSPGMPEEAPGRSAAYSGFKIIEQYMLRNPEVTLEQLLRESDAQKILNQSKYKP